MLPTAGWIANFEVEHDFPVIGHRWMLLNAQRIVGYGDRPDPILLAFNDATERKNAERHREMLVAELSHRVKNSLTVIQSVATQTLRNSKRLEEFGESFSGRIQALGRAHDIALNAGFQNIALVSVVAHALEPFRVDGRFEVAEGEAVELEPVASQSLTLMLHELATNALKYGALSSSAGTVSIDWRIDANDVDSRVAFTWIESGGPNVITPGGTGNGTRFIKGSVRHDLRGNATLDFQPEGLRATIAFPLKKPVPVTDVQT